MSMYTPLGTLPPLAADPDGSAPGPLARISVLAPLLSGLALMIDLSRFQQHIGGDDLIPVMASTQLWTPFFWRQDRYGMIAALLAQPLHNPLINLLAISWMSIVGSLAFFMLAARFLCGGKSSWHLVGLVALILHLALSPAHYIYETFGVAQFFTPAMALALGSLEAIAHVKPPWRMGSALALMGLAGWYNASVPMLLMLLVVARAVMDYVSGAQARLVYHRTPWWQARLVEPVALAGFGIAAGMLLRASSPWPQTWYNDPQHLPETLDSLALMATELYRELARESGYPLLLYAFVGALGLGLVAKGLRARDPNSLYQGTRGFLASLAACTLYAAGVANQAWVRQNLHHFRYLTPCVLLIFIGAVGFGLMPYLARLERRLSALLSVAAAALLAVTIVLRLGQPSLADVRAHIDRWAGRMTPAVLEAGATHIAGDYWRVWPAVFHANLVLYEKGAARQIFGLTHRGDIAQPLWPMPISSWRVAYAPDDPEANIIPYYFGGAIGLIVKDTPTMRLVVPQPPSSVLTP